jgi:RNA polymerase sigma factor for flagellar operon FliA
MEALVIKHIPMAHSIAVQIWRRAPQAMDIEELKSLAYLGLVSAATRWYAYCERNEYDSGRVEFFTTYATRRMKGSIFDSLRSSDWATRSQRTKFKQLLEAGQEQGASEEELIFRTGLTSVEVRATLQSMDRRPVSIDADALDYAIESDVEQNANESVMLSVVVDTIRSLSDAQQCVLAMHYFAGQELQEVAKRMNITESKASHLHTDAVLMVHAALLEALIE